MTSFNRNKCRMRSYSCNIENIAVTIDCYCNTTTILSGNLSLCGYKNSHRHGIGFTAKVLAECLVIQPPT